MSLKLQQTQSQKQTLSQQLVLTQQLQLSLRLLQMNRLELKEELQRHLLENPTLEEEYGEGSFETYSPDANEERGEGGAKSDAELNVSEASFENNIIDGYADNSAQFGMAEQEWDDYFDKQSYGSTAGRQMAVPDEDDEFMPESLLTSKPSLADYLRYQINVADFDETEKLIADEIIGNIDERGYLVSSSEPLRGESARAAGEEIEEISEEPLVKAAAVDPLTEIAEKLSLPIHAIEKIHAKVMRLDPPGVGARSLVECLAAQAKALYLAEDSIVLRIIRERLGLAAKNRLDKIAKDLSCSVEDVREALNVIKGFDPIPGRNFASDEPRLVIPDVVVEKIGDEFRVIVNDGDLPTLRINSSYKRLLKDKNTPQEARDYIKNKLNEAAMLVRAQKQRPRTIYRVAEIIVREQRAFLEKGAEAIRPMSLKEVADEVELHISTVSRATSNKYMKTPRGVFGLKMFFRQGLETSEGQDVVPEKVKRRIRQLVDSEDKLDPYTDDKLAQIINSEGVKITRRTVAKYRDIIGVPSRSVRRTRG